MIKCPIKNYKQKTDGLPSQKVIVQQRNLFLQSFMQQICSPLIARFCNIVALPQLLFNLSPFYCIYPFFSLFRSSLSIQRFTDVWLVCQTESTSYSCFELYLAPLLSFLALSSRDFIFLKHFCLFLFKLYTTFHPRSNHPVLKSQTTFLCALVF